MSAASQHENRTVLRRAALLLLSAVLFAALLLLGIENGSRARAEMQTRSFALIEATIPQLQAALTAGTVTSRDLVSMYLARIDAYDQRGPALNAISVTNANALSEADTRDAERRANKLRGPLHGIPVIVKDNYHTADMQTAAGSRSLAGWIPPDDAFLVKKLRDAGAVIIAKSNMHEFAYGITTLGSLFGQTRNPYAAGPQPRRFQRRHRGRDRRQFCRHRHGQRHLRFDPHPGVAQQPGRNPRDTGARQPQRDHSTFQHAGHRRADRPDCH